MGEIHGGTLSTNRSNVASCNPLRKLLPPSSAGLTSKGAEALLDAFVKSYGVLRSRLAKVASKNKCTTRFSAGCRRSVVRAM
jgi:hypothetical protein